MTTMQPKSAILGPDGMEAPSSTPAFPLTIDLRYGPTDAELCRMTFFLDGSVRGDLAKLRTWLSKVTTDVNPGLLLQWWMIAAMLQANVGADAKASGNVKQPATAGEWPDAELAEGEKAN
jgi:hypothetical protein